MGSFEKIEKMFKPGKAVKFDEIMKNLPSLSENRIRQILGKLKVMGSVNCNTRYYILPSQQQFDQQGLLSFDEVIFHREGKLLKAIAALVHESKMGLKSPQIDALLQTITRTHMAQLFKKNLISRVGKGAGAGYIYYSADQDVSLAQQEHRKQLKHEQEELRLTAEKAAKKEAAQQQKFDKDDVIAVLRTLIDSPDSTHKQVALLLQRGALKIKVSTSLAAQIFEAYELSEKKSKT